MDFLKFLNGLDGFGPIGPAVQDLSLSGVSPIDWSAGDEHSLSPLDFGDEFTEIEQELGPSNAPCTTPAIEQQPPVHNRASHDTASKAIALRQGKKRDFQCPQRVAELAMGRNAYTCTGVEARSMAEVRRNMVRGSRGRPPHLQFLKLCPTCNEDITDRYVFEDENGADGELCQNPRRQRKGAAAQHEQWDGLYDKIMLQIKSRNASPGGTLTRTGLPHNAQGGSAVAGANLFRPFETSRIPPTPRMSPNEYLAGILRDTVRPFVHHLIYDLIERFQQADHNLSRVQKRSVYDFENSIALSTGQYIAMPEWEMCLREYIATKSHENFVTNSIVVGILRGLRMTVSGPDCDDRVPFLCLFFEGSCIKESTKIHWLCFSPVAPERTRRIAPA